MTPTIVYGLLSSVIDWPTALGDPANRLCHSASLSSATPAPPLRSSSCVNARPIAGDTPSAGRTAAEIILAGTRSGSLPPDRVSVRLRNAPNDSNDDRLWSRQSA